MSSMEMVKGVLSKRVVGCSHCWDDGAESEGGGGRGVVVLSMKWYTRSRSSRGRSRKFVMVAEAFSIPSLLFSSGEIDVYFKVTLPSLPSSMQPWKYTTTVTFPPESPLFQSKPRDSHVTPQA